MFEPFLNAGLVPPIILPDTVLAVDNRQSNSGATARKHSSPSGKERRGILLFKQERCDEIAECISNKQARGGNGTLSISGVVGSGQAMKVENEY
jgi:hypothetical protein